MIAMQPKDTSKPRAVTRHTKSGVRVECETRIEAPRDYVWELIQEPTRRGEWDARLTRCDLLTPRPVGKGGRIRTAYGLLGWVEIEYTTWEPAARSAVKSVAVSRGNAIASLAASWTLRANADGSTTWKTQLLIRGGGGRLGPLLERLLIGPLMGWLTGLSARNLQRLAETEHAALGTPTVAAA
jgi:uncharacterized protein YndB with AHSA1/START domain